MVIDKTQAVKSGGCDSERPHLQNRVLQPEFGSVHVINARLGPASTASRVCVRERTFSGSHHVDLAAARPDRSMSWSKRKEERRGEEASREVLFLLCARAPTVIAQKVSTSRRTPFISSTSSHRSACHDHECCIANVLYSTIQIRSDFCASLSALAAMPAIFLLTAE